MYWIKKGLNTVLSTTYVTRSWDRNHVSEADNSPANRLEEVVSSTKIMDKLRQRKTTEYLEQSTLPVKKCEKQDLDVCTVIF
jgi:hypothetical protein